MMPRGGGVLEYCRDFGADGYGRVDPVGSTSVRQIASEGKERNGEQRVKREVRFRLG